MVEDGKFPFSKTYFSPKIMGFRLNIPFFFLLNIKIYYLLVYLTIYKFSNRGLTKSFSVTNLRYFDQRSFKFPQTLMFLFCNCHLNGLSIILANEQKNEKFYAAIFILLVTSSWVFLISVSG